MNKIIYYSNTNESYNIAKYISSKTNYELINILDLNEYNYDSIYLIFPVYYQSIPKEIRMIIKKLSADKAIVIATYGKMNYGNALNEVQKILNAKIVCAAYIPSKHTYIIDDNEFNEYDKLDNIINKMNNDEKIIIPKHHKNIFSSLFPLTRHRLAIKIKRNDKCISCNKCNTICKNINNGKVNNKCIRCLKCVKYCPYNGLYYKTSFFMKKYLKKKKVNEFIVY